MEQIIFRVEKSVKKRLKAKVAFDGQTMNELLGELVIRYLNGEIKRANG